MMVRISDVSHVGFVYQTEADKQRSYWFWAKSLFMVMSSRHKGIGNQTPLYERGLRKDHFP